MSRRGFNQDSFRKRVIKLDPIAEYWYQRGYQASKDAELPPTVRDGDRVAELFKRGQQDKHGSADSLQRG